MNINASSFVFKLGVALFVLFAVFSAGILARAQTATPYMTTSPSTGPSPLSVTFTTNVYGTAYYIDFGNGSIGWIGNVSSGSIIPTCYPDGSGGCVYKTIFTYSKNGTYIAKLMSGGVAVASVTITVGTGTDFQAPSAPTNASAVAIAPTSINVSWSPSTDNVGVASYKIYRTCCGLPLIPGLLVGTVSGAMTSFTDNTVVPATSYIYTITALDVANNASGYSIASPLISTPPTTVTPYMSVSPTTGSSPLSVTFTTNVAGSEFCINFGDEYSAWVGNKPNSGDAGACVFDGSGDCVWKTAHTYSNSNAFTAKLIYSSGGVSVLPCTGAAVSSATITVGTGTIIPPPSPTPDIQAPSSPQNLIASSVTKFQIGLLWSASTDNIGVTGYNVFRDGMRIGSATSTSYIDAGLSPGTTYSYAISAYDAAGNESSKSATLSATTLSSVFTIGTRIQTTVKLNVRAKSGTNSKILGTQPAGAVGTIIDGPSVKNRYTWWKVNFDSGVDGWVIQDFSTINILSVQSTNRALISVADYIGQLMSQVNNLMSKIYLLQAASVVIPIQTQ